VLQLFVTSISNIVLVLFLVGTNTLETNKNKNLRIQIWELNFVGTNIFKNKNKKLRMQVLNILGTN
jgi:hypothetical protein